MMKSLVLGSLLGGLVAFLWSSVSWALLPWHEAGVLRFQNEDAIAAVLMAQTTQSGTYLMPLGPSAEGMGTEQKKLVQAGVIAKMKTGPILYAAVRRGGFGSYARAVVIQFVSLVLAACLLTWLLLQTSGLSYWKRVVFLGVVGLAAGVISDIPNWNWWGFSGEITAVNLADFTLTWLIAGLAIARVARPEARPSRVAHER